MGCGLGPSVSSGRLYCGSTGAPFQKQLGMGKVQFHIGTVLCNSKEKSGVRTDPDMRGVVLLQTL